MYEVFRRDRYSRNDDGEIYPCVGESTFMVYVDSIEEARAVCKEYNEENDAGELSHKAEFRSV